MMNFAKFAVAAVLSAALFAVPARASDETELIASANQTVNNLKTDAAFAQAAKMLHTAKAVLIIPKLVKGGFIFGAEGGSGVLLKRNGRSWSQPAFFTLGSASFGLQIGLQQAQLVFIIMSDRALAGIVHGETKLGAGAGLTVVTLSAGAEGATTAGDPPFNRRTNSVPTSSSIVKRFCRVPVNDWLQRRSRSCTL